MSTPSRSLFSETPPSRTGPSRFALSALLHGAACGAVLLAAHRSPRVADPTLASSVTVHLLDLHQPEHAPRPSMAGPSGSAGPAGRPAQAARAALPVAGAPGSGANALASADQAAEPEQPAQPIVQQLAQTASVLQKASQTLIQPDLPRNILPHHTPLPTVLMWSPEQAAARVIVAPPPRPLTTATIHPSLEAPNRETTLAETKMAASDFATHAPTLPPSTTAPVAVPAPPTPPQMAQAASKPLALPTPARVISLSDLQMPEGTVALPPANQSASGSALGLALNHPIGAIQNSASKTGESGTGASGQAHGAAGAPGDHAGPGAGRASGPGTGQPAGTATGQGDRKGTDAGKGQDAGASGRDAGTGTRPGSAASGQGNGNGAGPAVASNGSGTGPAAGQGTGRGTGQGAAGAAGSGDSPSGNGVPGSGAGGAGDAAVAHLKQRKDGSFGVVVVGSSADANYPEAAGVWGGRLAYTVYLHVGMAKNWILEYSLPRSATASINGTITRPDAPWPYDIVRPQLAPSDGSTDAVLVHGMVNTAGRFEQLGVVFPVEFAQSRFLLSALEQWQFRPAMENGQIAPVEVLLIIPLEAE